MTWEIFLGIVALVGFVITVTSPFIKLNKVMTELSCAVRSLQQTIADMNTRFDERIKRIWEHNEEQDGTIKEHEKRIIQIECNLEKENK